MTDHAHDEQVATYGICVTCRASGSSTLDEGSRTGSEARDDALLRVEAGAPLSWLIQARRVIRDLAATGQPFTSDDVWARLDQPPEPRALGAAIAGEAKAGLIVNTGRTRPSQRAECHARPVAIWIVGAQAVDRSGDDQAALW